MRHVVVVGHGMVGSRFAELLVEADPQVRVTVLGKEPVAAYNRVLLSSVVAGSKSPGVLGLAGPSHPRVEVLTGVGAAAVDRDRRVVVDDRGREHGYDELVLATGSAARVPPIQGVAYDEGLVEGVFVLKDMADATGIVEAAGNAPAGGRPRRRRARRGGRHRPGEAWPQRPDRPPRRPPHGAPARLGGVAGRDHQPGAARHHDPRRGLRRRRQRPAAAGSRASASRDGVEAAADLFVMCCGTVAETMLARRAGLTVDRGIVVTDDLASPDDPHVHAIGDCAQPPSGATGLVAQGWQQAAALVATLSPGAVSPGTGAGDPRRGPGQGVRDVDGEHGRLRGLRPQRPALPRPVPQGPRARSLRGGRGRAAATSSARRASVTRRSPRPCRRSTPARCRSPTTPRSSW